MHVKKGHGRHRVRKDGVIRALRRTDPIRVECIIGDTRNRRRAVRQGDGKVHVHGHAYVRHQGRFARRRDVPRDARFVGLSLECTCAGRLVRQVPVEAMRRRIRLAVHRRDRPTGPAGNIDRRMS